MQERKLKEWFLSSFEGTDGRADGKKLTMFFFTMLSGFMIFSQVLWATQYPEVAWWVIPGGAVGAGLSDIPGRIMNNRSSGSEREITRRRG